MNGIIHVYTYTDIQDPVESSQGSDEDETHWERSFFQRGLETNWRANTHESGDAELAGWGGGFRGQQEAALADTTHVQGLLIQWRTFSTFMHTLFIVFTQKR